MRSNPLNSAILALLDDGRLESAFQSEEGDLVWKVSETMDVVNGLSGKNVAALGGDFAVVENGGPVVPREGVRAFFNVWNTRPHQQSEAWAAYCERTISESLSEINKFLKLKELEDMAVLDKTFIRLDLAFPSDPKLFVPRGKHDHERAAAAIAAGYPAVGPVLPQLLEWLQDMNWPVASTLEPFIARIGIPLAPHIEQILETDDEIWKYWIIQRILSKSPELVRELSGQLLRIANDPTPSEVKEEIDEEAREVLREHGLLNPNDA